MKASLLGFPFQGILTLVTALCIHVFLPLPGLVTLPHMKQYMITALIVHGNVYTPIFLKDQRWNVHFWVESEQILNRPDLSQDPSPVNSGLLGAAGCGCHVLHIPPVPEEGHTSDCA